MAMNSAFMSSELLDLQDLTLNPRLSFQPCGRELRTLREGAPDPAEWLQFCVYYFFIAFNCLTQEVPKGPNSPQTYLTPKELLVYQQKNRDLLNMRWTLH